MQMTLYEKAAAIADKLRNMTELRVLVTAEDVLRKAEGNTAEIEFYYERLCKNVQ